MEKYQVEVTVNGEKINAETRAQESLLKFLRRNGFTDVKNGCEQGDCGTCTVIMAGNAIKSCTTLAMQANGKEVWTLKGMEHLEIGKKLQESFVKHGAIQCGFCTAGMVNAAKAYLDRGPQPNREDIRKAISGNLCRCTGYQKIIDAIYDVALESIEK